MSILNEIIKFKKEEVASRKRLFPIARLEESIYFGSPIVSLVEYLKRDDKAGVIAEFKRRSPSKPSINLYADIEEVSIGYMQAGASALSVLTDEHYFGGNNKDLMHARSFNFCPILRKDFINDTYQIVETRSIGADAILLIAEVLSIDEVANLSAYAKELGLEVLLEIHNADQIEKISDDVDVIGVNNRNLKTFKTDVQHSIELFDNLPRDIVKISESGIHSADQMLQLSQKGFDGFLIGELFMSHSNPAKACQKLIQDFVLLKSQAI